MIREFLTRLQELQRDTLGTNINIWIDNRHTFGDTWVSVTAMTEERTEDNKFVGYLSESFNYYDFESEGENRARMEENYNRIVEFIKLYKNEN